MFFKFCMTRSKQTKFSSLSQRLGACFSSRVLSLAIATVAVAPLPSVAGTIPVIPAPLYSVALVHQGLGCPGEFAPGTYACGGVSATVAGFPDARISATEHDSFSNANSGTVALAYYFAVVGPVDFVPVPMLVTFSMGASASPSSGLVGTFGSDALFSVGPADNSFARLVLRMVTSGGATCGTFCFGTDFSGTMTFNQPSGALGQVFMRVLTAGRSRDFCADCAGDASGFVDPFISIDPAFLLTHPGYSVIVSEGIGNVAPAAPGVPGVPEPVTLALFASGLLGFIARRRRRI